MCSAPPLCKKVEVHGGVALDVLQMKWQTTLAWQPVSTLKPARPAEGCSLPPHELAVHQTPSTCQQDSKAVPGLV